MGTVTYYFLVDFCALCGEEEIWPQEAQDAQKKNVL